MSAPVRGPIAADLLATSGQKHCPLCPWTPAIIPFLGVWGECALSWPLEPVGSAHLPLPAWGLVGAPKGQGRVGGRARSLACGPGDEPPSPWASGGGALADRSSENSAGATQPGWSSSDLMLWHDLGFHSNPRKTGGATPSACSRAGPQHPPQGPLPAANRTGRACRAPQNTGDPGLQKEPSHSPLPKP